MGNINFKHLIGLLVVCALLSACGKDNKKETAAATPVPCNPYYSSLNPSGTPCVVGTTTYTPTTSPTFGDFESFRTAVRNGQFVPVSGFHEIYKYGSCGTSTDSWFIFTWGTSSCSASFTVDYMGTTVTGSTYGSNEAAIKAKLVEIVNAASGAANTVQIISNQRVRFVSGSYIYEYHLGYPAVANPVSRSSLNGSSRYDLYSVQSFGM
ncbi:MAG: hypothetical protein A2X86_17335 [Bdellovibrionales bacterium GWA2_49_15]|nr:MAG: hypothetical protein A2X86_17335 [Bdellovibrionales bacterium GWA2_49_15]HAZ13997.1 hypothetical protein [Bdellovibrionales bacterium]